MTPKTKKKTEQIQNCETPNRYKQTDAGILPNDWDYARLSDISEQITQTAGTEKYETVSISAGIGFVNQAKKFGKELSGKQYAKYTVLHKGDFSYNKGNSKKYPQGCVYRLKDRETAAVPNVFESFRITTGCAEYYDQLFISGYLNHQLYRLINHGVRDDGLLNLTHKDFYSCLLPVPPLPEQKRIAKILSAQDKVIECYEKKIDQLKRMKKYYLQNMFPKRGETVPKIRFKEFAGAWEQRKIGDYCDMFNGDRSAKYPNAQDMVSEGIPFINAGDLVDGHVNLVTANRISRAKYDDLSGAKLQLGDIVYCLRGTLGKNAYIDSINEGTIASSLVSIRPKNIDGKFLFHVLNSDIEYRQRIICDEGAAQPNLSEKSVSEFMIPVPDLEEQKMLSSLLDNLSILITLHQRKLEEEKKKKKALQQLLLTGIVRINHG